MPLLDGLSRVDWSALHHAYGAAVDVPDLLHALVEPDSAPTALCAEAKGARRDIRDHVEWTLWGNVFHQGTRWQVTATVVPFLVEILRDGPKDDELRRFLISYLHHLAIGYPEDTFPDRIDPDEAFRALEGKVDPGGEPDYGQDASFGIWARDAYLAVEEAIDTIARFIDADDNESALEAIALVASFPRCGTKTVPLLREVARTRRDQRAAHAVISLAQLVDGDALEDAAHLVASDDRAVAVQAACAVILEDATRVSNDAIGLLTAPLGDLAGARSTHAGSLSQLVGRCLVLVPGSERERAMDAIAYQHRDATPIERVSLSASLLSLAFAGERAPDSAAGLTPPQRRAIEAIRDHGAFVIDNAQFTNYALLMREWGLPDSAKGVRDWLEGREPEAGPTTRSPWWKLR
ncbi:MAG: hypothetical protein HYU52_14060 [Acidobacteria bacterium]|nr:hypothetical protein [Acidobacteriota bacterium]